MFKYPDLISKLTEDADAVEADIDDFTTDLIHFSLMARVQRNFDEDGQLLDRDGLLAESSNFVKTVIMAVANFTAAFCDEPTEEDEAVLSRSQTKH